MDRAFVKIYIDLDLSKDTYFYVPLNEENSLRNFLFNSDTSWQVNRLFLSTINSPKKE
jgi:hypothetical protein